MHLYYDHTLYSFPLYKFLWPEEGQHWPKHVVISIINKIQDSCVLTYPAPSLIAYDTTAMINLNTCTHHPIPFGDKIEKNEMGGACSAYGLAERRVQVFWWGNLRERDHLGDPDVDGRMILRWIFRNWGCRSMDWIKLAQDRDKLHLWMR